MQPFLSVVIPCYNSKFLNKGLQSIVDCQMDDIEVILADDCSTESYSRIVDNFVNNLNIVTCKNEYNCGSPSNGRELGAQIATGTYITFMDHDDYLDPDGITKFRKLVESENYPEYVVCGIRQVDPDGNTEVEKFGILPFLHGKFFHREKFYKKCDLHHKKDIKYSEDNWFTSLVACNLIKYQLAPIFTDFCTYCWHNNMESLSKSLIERKMNDLELNLKIFQTNLSITYDTTFKFFDKGDLPINVATEWWIREIVSLYFDSQLYFHFFEHYKPFLKEFIQAIKDRLKYNNKDILDYALSDGGRLFQDELNNMLQFWPVGWGAHQRFEQFLDSCSHDESLNDVELSNSQEES